jgi:hypothetical protein
MMSLPHSDEAVSRNLYVTFGAAGSQIESYLPRALLSKGTERIMLYCPKDDAAAEYTTTVQLGTA